MTKYRLEVNYQDYRYMRGWYWILHEVDEDGRIIDSKSCPELWLFRWTAILEGRLAARKRERAARKTPYTKEFTI